MTATEGRVGSGRSGNGRTAKAGGTGGTVRPRGATVWNGADRDGRPEAKKKRTRPH